MLALLKRAFYQEFTAQTPASTPESEQMLSQPAQPSVQKFSTDTTSPVSSSKSFRQAVEGLPCNNQHNEISHFDQRLATAELRLKEHEDRLKIIDQQAEAARRASNKLRLVLYGVPEQPLDSSEGPSTIADIAGHHLEHIAPEAVNSETDEQYGCIGSLSSKPRPLEVVFKTEEKKHAFLKHAKKFRQAGIRCDDYLTKLQQQETQALSTDFDALKTKGHAPFYRGQN